MPDTPLPPVADADTAGAIRAEQVRLLYASPSITLGNLVNAALACALLFNEYPALVWAAWLSLFAVVVAARILLCRRYNRSQPRGEATKAWAWAFAAGSGLTGVLWGLAASVVFVSGDAVDAVFVAFMLGGMAAGSVLRDSVWPPAFYAFAIPAILPLIVALLAAGEAVFVVMAVMLAIFSAALAATGLRNSRWVTENVRLRLKEARLNEELQSLALEQRRVTQALQDSNERLRAISDHAQDAFIIADHAGDIVFWNPAAQRMFGYTPEEIQGRSASILLADEGDREAAIVAYRSLAQAGVRDLPGRTLSLQAVRKDGTRFPADVSVSAMQINGEWHALGVARDVSERERAHAAIENLNRQMAASLDALKAHAEEMGAIARLSDTLQTCRSRQEAYPIIATAAANLFDGTSGGLAVVSDESGELETVARWGEPGLSPEFAVADCWGLRTGRRYDVAGAGKATPCRHFRETPPGAYVCLPLAVHGETTGLLYLAARPGAAVTDDLQRLLQTFGDVLKLSLSNLKLREVLSEQAMRDPLTGLFNRRYLSETLPREIRRARRGRKPLCVALLDVDHFKALNDAHGHPAGDRVLKIVGGLLRDSLRAGDIVCRYGGEEFVVVLPNCALGEAKARLQQICAEVEATAMVHGREPLPTITLSAGVAEMSAGLTSAEALIGAADQALYKAKKNGRNRIEVFGRPDVSPLPSRSATRGGPKHPARRLQAS